MKQLISLFAICALMLTACDNNRGTRAVLNTPDSTHNVNYDSTHMQEAPAYSPTDTASKKKDSMNK